MNFEMANHKHRLKHRLIFEEAFDNNQYLYRLLWMALDRIGGVRVRLNDSLPRWQRETVWGENRFPNTIDLCVYLNHTAAYIFGFLNYAK